MESHGKSPHGGRGAQSGLKEHWGNKNGKGHRTQDEKGILPAQNTEAGKTKSASQQCHGGQRLGFEAGLGERRSQSYTAKGSLLSLLQTRILFDVPYTTCMKR